MEVWYTKALSPQGEKINACLKYMQRRFQFAHSKRSVC